MALKTGIKVMLYGNGIGPLVHEESRRKTAKCLNKVDLITLRDDLSDKLLAEIGVNKPPIHITADPAFTLSFEDLPKNDSLIAEAGIPEGSRYAVIAIREWKLSVSDFTSVISSFCDYLYEKFGIVSLFLPMQYKQDEPVSTEIISKMKHNGYMIKRPLEINEVFSLIGHSALSLGMRLHTLIYATTLGVPVIALSYDPKVTAFMQSIHQPLCIDVESLTSEVLLEAAERLVKELSERRKVIASSLMELRQKAEQNADYAVEFLKN